MTMKSNIGEIDGDVITFEDDDGNVLWIPWKYDVCDECNGHGKVTNPSIGAITSSEWNDDWDHDERIAYFRGDYDIVCYKCNGKRVIEVPDEAAMCAEARDNYKKYCEIVSENKRFQAEERQYRRMECGY